MPIEDFFFEQDKGNLKKGAVVSNVSADKTREKVVHYSIKGIKDMTTDFYNLYKTSSKKPTKKDFLKIIDKHLNKRDDNVDNFLDRLENEDELFQVVKRKKKGGKIIIELEKVSNKERMKIIRSIVDKLMKKVKPKQLRSMWEEVIRKNNDIEDLKAIEKKLKSKKKIKVEDKKGCFKFVIGDKELMIIR